MNDSFNERESQFEAKFAHDEELKFKIIAHRSRLFAAWVADQMGESAPPDYADGFVAFALGRSAEALIEQARNDLHDHGIALADTKLSKAFEQAEQQAEIDVSNAA
ncbi:MAG TPA: ATPase inhibitor subunit zeta [Alphaproteobacteria bacterium]|jgi:hypothetical protein|nr:ATPase inhibitor subunit zeta [Alphaproteobacteria bacterium]